MKLVVQRWCAGQWEFVRPFALSEVEQANDFALKLSMTKRIPVETAVFENGEKVDPLRPIAAWPFGAMDNKFGGKSENLP